MNSTLDERLDRLEKISNLFNEGFNKYEIAKQTGYSVRTVAQVLSKNGFTIPSSSAEGREKELVKERILQQLKDIGIDGKNLSALTIEELDKIYHKIVD
jgi:hypothetical protein